MKVINAKSAGFCYGVDRAVAICKQAAKACPGCVMLGPVIHNGHVISELRDYGLYAVSDITGVPQCGTVIIRCHGAGKKELEEMSALGFTIIDATCPVVKRIHDIAANESANGRLLVIIGDRSHPEVIAISGWCDEHIVFENAAELTQWLQHDGNATRPVSVVFQTTSTQYVYKSCAEVVKKVCTNQKVFDTICDATFKRQQEAAELSRITDVMIVLGGKNSSNSLKLFDICKENNSRAVFAESIEDLECADIGASDVVGITAGASTPAWIIKEVTQKMSDEVRLEENRVENESVISDPDLVSPEPELTVEPEPTAAPVSAAEPDPAEEQETETEYETEAVPKDETEPDTELKPAQEPADLTAGYEAFDVPEDLISVPETPEDPDAAEGLNDPAYPDQAAGPGASFETEEAAAPETGITDTDEPAANAGEPAVLDIDIQELDITERDTAAQEESAADDEDAMQGEQAPLSESFAEMLERSIKTLHTGEKVTGVVTSITATEVSVDLGTKQSGYIPIGEFLEDADSRIEDIIKVGDAIETFVMRVNDVEGMVMLSKKRLDAIKNWDIIEAAKDSRAIVEGLVTEENKGGVVVNVKGVRVFVPASQTGLPKSSPMSELVKRSVKLRITEVNQSRRRVVGSIRAVQADERREKSDRLWTEIETGKQYSGVVKSMTTYGVFVDIGGVDGMIHISELSWTRIKQPSEVMAVGEEVQVYVLSFDKENRKISLGFKKQEDNPWTRFRTGNSVGDIVNVKIVKMMPFGAFAEIIPGVDGLIHISQITDHRIGLPSEVLTNGQHVNVKITEIDNDRRKVSLSIRALIDPASQPVTDAEAANASASDKTPVVVYDTDSPPDDIPEMPENTTESDGFDDDLPEKV